MGAFPVKWNPVTIKIRQLQTSGSNLTIDPIFNEAASPISFGSEITLEGQVNLMNRSFDRLFYSLTGDQKGSFGHLTFKNPITTTGGTPVTLRKGDKITSIAGVASDLFITQIRPESPLNGEILLWYVEFTNNQEARNSL